MNLTADKKEKEFSEIYIAGKNDRFEKNDVYDRLIRGKVRLVNRVEDKRFALKSPVTFPWKAQLDCLLSVFFPLPPVAFYTCCNSASMRCNLRTTGSKRCENTGRRKELNSR